MTDDVRHPPSAVLTVTLLLNVSFATVVAFVHSAGLALLIVEQHDNRTPDRATLDYVLTSMLLSLHLMPGFWLFGALISTLSWAWHASTDSPRPIAVDGALGLVGGLLLGAICVAQDAMGIRPEEFGGPFSTNLVVVVLSSVVLGGVLGFASGGITSRVLARARNSDAAASRLATSLNAVVLYFVVIPSLSLLFTFAHFTGTSSRWDILEAPFVLLIALMTLGGLGVVHAALVGVFVIAHRTVAHGIGTALLDGLVSAVLATGAVVGGVLFLDKGIEDFPDQLSFSVAAGATLGFAALIGATFGAGWGRARRGPAQAKAR